MTDATNEDKAPKLFISYRWSCKEHEEWVVALATSLVSLSVDVKLDRWHLKEGQDALAFMESMVTDDNIDKVLLICDRGYVERADEREGGVGVESQIVSAKVYNSTSQTKFAAAVLEYDAAGKPLLPVYLTNRIYFDLSTQERFTLGLEQIVRWCYGRPFYIAPKLGKRPGFLNETYEASPENAVNASRLRATQFAGYTSRVDAATDLLRSIEKESSSLLLTLIGKPDADELVITRFLDSCSDLDSVYQAFAVLLNSSTNAVDIIHGFLNDIGKHWDSHPMNIQYSKLDNDALRMFAQCCLIGLIAVGIKERRFLEVGEILAIPFFRPDSDNRTGKASLWTSYCDTYYILNNVRNTRLQNNRISVFADVAKDALLRIGTVTFEQFLEADLTLYLRSILEARASQAGPAWYPMTGVFATHTFGSLPLFVHGESAAFWRRVEPMLGVDGVDQVRHAIEPYRSGEKNAIRFDYEYLNLPILFNVEKLSNR